MSRTLDLILPFYHPHPGWVENDVAHITALRRHFEERGVQLTVYAVNDGWDMADFPSEKLDAIRAAAGGRFTFIDSQPNRGKGYSLRAGVSAGAGDIRIYTDHDFPFGSRSVIDAYNLLDSGAEVVMGVRGREYSHAIRGLRRMISKMVRKLNALLLGLPPELCDTQAGFKGFRGAGIDAFLDTTVNAFLFDTEFILLARKRRLSIVPIPLVLRDGLHFSRMGFRTLLRETANLFRILWKVRIRGGCSTVLANE
ncbi:MAG: hypothetical protein VB042_04960 [Victivallaceae bacterium]|nr:hypothetical protein [Victivallaceae bacterium]